MGTVSVFLLRKKNLFSLSADAERSTTHHLTDKYMLDDVSTARALHRKSSRQCVASHFKECERLLAYKTVSGSEFRKLLKKIPAKIDHIPTSLHAEMKCPFALDSKCFKLLVFESM